MGFLGRISPPTRDRTGGTGTRGRRPSGPGVERPRITPRLPTPGVGSVTGVRIARDAITGSKVSPLLLQTGQVQISLSNASNGTGNVTFARRFTTTPRVFLTLNSSSLTTVAWTVGAESITTTGFTVRIRHINDTNQTVTITIQYMAVDVDE